MSSQWQSSTMQWDRGTFLRAPSPGRSDGAVIPAEIGDFSSAAASEGVKAGAESSGAERHTECLALYGSVKRATQGEWWRAFATPACGRAERIVLGCDAIAPSRVVFRLVSS